MQSYQVPSHSHPGVVYEVKETEGVWTCSCPDFTIRHKRTFPCKHIMNFRWQLGKKKKPMGVNVDETAYTLATRLGDLDNPKAREFYLEVLAEVPYGVIQNLVIESIEDAKRQEAAGKPIRRLAALFNWKVSRWKQGMPTKGASRPRQEALTL